MEMEILEMISYKRNYFGRSSSLSFGYLHINHLLISLSIWKWTSTCYTPSNDTLGESLGLNENYILTFRLDSHKTYKPNAWWFNCSSMSSTIDRWINLFSVLIVLIIIAFLALIVAVAIDYN